MDVLRDKSALKKTLAALGGIWDSRLNFDFDAATAEFRTARKPSTNSQILGAITAVLKEDPMALYGSDTKKAVALALSLDSPWDAVKKHGMSAFMADRPAADRLLRQLASQGVVVVPVGELERFAPSLGVSKGKNWLPAALEVNAHRGVEAQSYARSIADAIIIAEARSSA